MTMGLMPRSLTAAILGGLVFLVILYDKAPVQPQNTTFGVHEAIKDRSKNSSKEISETSDSQSPRDPAFNLDLNPNKRIIILLTAFRSGSTFLGKLFDSNPTMQYLFEPFHDRHMDSLRGKKFILGVRPDHTESDLRMLYLQQMLHNCAVSPSHVLSEKYRWCGSPAENLHRFNTTQCEKPLWVPEIKQQEISTGICRYRNITVIKVIRMHDLSDLLKISQIRTANIQIIQLLRHPVPCMMSRRTGLKFFSENQRTKIENSELPNLQLRRTKTAWEAFNYCHDHLKTIEFVGAHTNWLKDRYMRVTHREMSLKPLETAEKIYSFINETLTDEIKEYITNITTAKPESVKGSSKRALDRWRNSTQVATKWKKLNSATVKLWDVVSMEALCKLLFEPMNDVFSVDGLSRKQLMSINAGMDDLYDLFDSRKPNLSGDIYNRIMNK